MTVTQENYYSPEADWQYMSVSQFKAFDACEAAALATLQGDYHPPVTPALLVGSYVDAFFEGTLGEFREAHPEILKRDGSLRAEFVRAAEMIERAHRDALFLEYMSGEKQKIFTAELFGVPWKIKVDSYHPGRMLVDLKTARSLQRIMGRSLVEHYRYDIQGAVYQAVEGHGLPFYLAIVTKEDPPDLEICEIERPELAEALDDVRKRLPRVLAVKRGEVEAERCGVCPWCRITKRLTAPIPADHLGFSNFERKMTGGTI